MRDLHCHLLPGVDDGSRNIKTTREMLKQAMVNGVSDIMFTPHYILDSKYVSNKSSNTFLFDEIRKIAKEEYHINIFLGNEVYCNRCILDLLKNAEISTLNNSRYLLMEIPMHSKINDLKSILFEIISNGIVPILAHPERYTSYYKDYDFFYELRNMGVLLQLNYVSLLGDYGSHAKKMAQELLKRHLISFVGSDIHSPDEEKYNKVNPALKKLRKYVDEDEFIAITENNFAKVIYNEEI